MFRRARSSITRSGRQTRGEHRLLVRAYAGFGPFSERELDALGGRFVDAVLEHERPSLLLVRLCEILRAGRVERPSIDRLVRLVRWARERAHERTFVWLGPQLSDEVRAKLDGLLVTEDGRCGHAWLRTRPTSVSVRALGRELEKRAFLIGELGADRFDFEELPPNRRTYGVLIPSAQHEREELEHRGRRGIQTTVPRFIDLFQVVLEAHDSGGVGGSQPQQPVMQSRPPSGQTARSG